MLNPSRILLALALVITTGLTGCGGEEEVEAVCGNGIMEPGESCDGVDLGGLMCTDYAAFGELAGGTVGCSATCTVDVSSCQSCWTYPCGPYGGASSKGTLMENLGFVAANDPAKTIAGDGETLTLSDLYLMSTERGGELRGAFLFQTAGWCPYCRDEAQYLNTLYEQFKADGIILIGVIAQDEQGQAATTDYAAAYGGTYGWTFPSVAGMVPDYYDPSGGMPLNIFIDLTDMTIFNAYNGAPQQWQAELELKGLSQQAGR